MNVDRWEQVNSLFHAVLEREPEERTAFMLEACAGDEALCEEVESLIASHKQAASFIETPAVALATDLLARNQARSIERRFRHYKIVALLGAGGMAEVYLAHDMRLGRPVALKILPASFSREAERIRRFQREARAISALNHPNIVTIFEIGEADGLRYIATEYVEGETLRSPISRCALTIPEAMDIVIQVAGALEAAHDAGFAHRDIKPENIMVRPDGRVKLVDFGLAKLTECKASVSSSRAQTPPNISTSPGIIMGTVNYMSPEQARGLKVDARSDIFSLGVVLYEAVTGRLPFTGETMSDVIAAILREEPLPLTCLRPDAPAGLESIIIKALSKVQEERYQSINELSADLKNLSCNLNPAVRSGLLPSSGPITRPVTRGRASSARYFATQIKQHKLGAGIATLLVMLAVLGLYKSFALGGVRLPMASEEKPPLALPPSEKMTSDGESYWMIAPDGNYAVYRKKERDGWWLIAQHITSGEKTRLEHFPNSIKCWGCTISPDYFAYCWMEEAANPGKGYIERIPILGGEKQRVIERINSRVSFSPDGQQVAFSRRLNSEENAIILADCSGGNERELVRRPSRNVWFGEAAWSPDGSLIAANVGINEDGESYVDLIGIRVLDGAQVPLSQQRWGSIRNVAWLPDGRGIVISAVDRLGNYEHIWEISYPESAVRRLTNEVGYFAGVSITSDGSKLFTGLEDRPSDIWIAPASETNRAEKLTPNTSFYNWVDWTSDGRIIYDLNSPSGANIWIRNADGSNKKQLTFGSGNNGHPVVTADGRSVVFVSNRTGAENLWVIDIESGSEKQLTYGKRDWWPAAVPNSRWVLYKSQGQNSQALLKISLDGGPPVPITEGALGFLLAASPDGRRVAYQYHDEARKKDIIAVRPLDGGPVEKTLEMDGVYTLKWSPDGKSLISAHDGANLWQFPLDGKPGKRITNFPLSKRFPDSGIIISFAYSRDGKKLIATRGTWTSDVMVIHLK